MRRKGRVPVVARGVDIDGQPHRHADGRFERGNGDRAFREVCKCVERPAYPRSHNQ